MGDNYYSINTDSTQCPNDNIFSKCMLMTPKIGIEIEHNTTTINQGYNENTYRGNIIGKDETTSILNNIIPFIVDRKFCHYNANDKNGQDSNYPLFDIQNHTIVRELNTNYQIDDIVKNNIINTFTSNIINEITQLFTNLTTQTFSFNIDQNALNLDLIYQENINELKKDIKFLNGDKLKQEKYYSSKYYDLNRYKTNTNILINSIFIVSIIFVINVLSNNNIISYGFYINTFLAGCLVLYLMLAMSSIKDRQFSNWDKKYFSYVNDISDTV